MSRIHAIHTTGGIAIDGPNEDDAYDAERQLEVDEIAAKRAASGLSPEQLSLQEAFAEGARAAGFGHRASMNRYQDTVPEHAQWERGRLSALGAAVNLQACRYFKGEGCDCGGRGVCLDAA